MLYLTAGIPAAAQARMISQMSSISRSRSGLLASMMFGRSAREISLDICGFELRWPLGNYRDEQGSRLSPALEARMAEWEERRSQDSSG